MKKILLLITILISFHSFGQLTNFPNYTTINQGYHWYRGVFNQLHVPGFSGTPTLRTGQWIGDGAVGIDTTGNKFYFYTNTTWRELFKASDTTNKWVIDVYVRNDTIFKFKNGAETFVGLIVGGSGGANNYPTSLAFGTGTGILTVGRNGLGDLTASIDGRYVVISDTASMLGVYLRANVAAATYTPLARTITINGTTLDLSANRSWTVGDVLTTRTISTQHSLTGGGDLSANRTINLVNDVASPGNNKVYGTDGTGVRGWKDDPVGGGGGISSLGTTGTDLNIGGSVLHVPSASYTNRGALTAVNHKKFDFKRSVNAYTPGYGEPSPLIKTSAWRLPNSAVWTDSWRDGSWIQEFKGRVYLGNGWFNNGITYVTDSIRLFSTDYTTTSHAGFMPFAGHSISTAKLPNGGIMWAFNDDNSTATERKSVYYLPPEGELPTSIGLKTSDWGGGERTLAGMVALPDGSVLAGGGQTTATDSSTSVSDLWISWDLGATWTQIQSTVSDNGFAFLGGNSLGRWHVLNDRLHVFGRSTQDNDVADRVNWENHYSIALVDILDETKWVREEDIPHANSYQAMSEHDGEFYIIGGSNNIDGNTKWVDVRTKSGTWYSSNTFIGFNPLDLNFSTSHARPMISFNGELLLGSGNVDNSFKVLTKSQGEFILSGHKNIIGKLGIGNNGYDGAFWMNLPDSNYFDPEFPFDINSGNNDKLNRFRFRTNHPYTLYLGTQDLTDGYSGVNYNQQWWLGTAHTGTGSGFASGFGIQRMGDVQWPWWVYPSGHMLVNNNSTTIPTNFSALQVIGLPDSINASFKTLKSDAQGNIYEDSTVAAGASFANIQEVSDPDDATENVFINTTDNRMYYKIGGFIFKLAISDSADAFDPDARAYLDAVTAAGGSYSAGLSLAVNAFVVGVKADDTWDDMTAIYPMIGGTAASHVINLKTPGTYNLTFNGGWTHTSTGSDPNGSTGYANTGLNPNTVFGNNILHFSFYSTQNVSGGVDVGFGNGTDTQIGTLWAASFGTTRAAFGSDINQAFVSEVAADGFFVASRTSATDIQIYKDATSLNTNTTSDTNTPESLNVYIGAHNRAGTASYFAARNCGFASIGIGINSTKVTSLTSRVQTLQAAR